MIVKVKKHKAHKPHECSLSKKRISVGDEYYTIFQKFPECATFIKVSSEVWKFIEDMMKDFKDFLEDDGIDEETYNYLFYTVKDKTVIRYENGDVIVV